MQADLVITNARLVTLARGAVPRRGRDALRDIGIVECGDLVVQNGTIAAIGPDAARRCQAENARRTIHADGRIVLPGFVDCHTHACWSGDRLDEFQLKLEGADYLSLLQAGGGIMSTVRATRAASLADLTTLTLGRLDRMLDLGTTSAEVKSGYGLDTNSELKMLSAIKRAAGLTPMRIVATALIAHAIDPDQTDFIDRTIGETLEAVAETHPGICIDAYCEEGAWSLSDTRRLFERASDLGCPIRIHTDQFHSLGGTRLALELGAISVDHLEATVPEDIELIARSRTAAVVLPISGFHVDGRYAPGRALVDLGASLALATNYNPGSAPSPSMPFAIALACRKLGLTPAEAISAATINGAFVLGLDDEVGSLVSGKRADFTMWDETDERQLAYELASIAPCLVVCGGEIVRDRIAART